VNSGSPGNLLHAGFSLAQVTGGLFQTVYGEGDDQGNNSGTFNGLSSFTLSCSGGVLNWENAEMTMPGVITSAGLFLMDGPETFGGVVAAKTTVMATIDDLANTSADILWQDKEVGACSSHSGCTDILNVTFGAEDNTGAVPATFSSLNGSTIPTINFRAASNTTAANATTQFASVNSGYTNNSLALTYPEPQNIPGLFYSDQTTSGQATPTLLIVAKINGKLLIFGSNGTTGTGGVTMCGPSLTYQSSAPTGDPSLAGLVCEPASGNFIGFEP
jgi:hypothetical protein